MTTPWSYAMRRILTRDQITAGEQVPLASWLPVRAIVTADALNVRDGPGVTYPICRRLQGGAEVETWYRERGWALTEDGWVSAAYLREEA